MRIRFATFLLGLMACLIFFPVSVQAQDNKLPAATLAAFQASPGSILATYPSGGPEMVSFVARLLASDIELLDEIAGLIEAANPAQKAAIGAGMGRAAKYYESLAEAAVDDAARQAAIDKAESIARAVAENGNTIVMASFAAGTGDAPAAIAPAAAAAPGGAAPGGAVGASAAGGGSNSSGGGGGGGSSGFLSAGGAGSGGGGGGGASASPTS